MPTGVKLPPIEQAAGSMSVLPTGTVLVKNADTGVAVSIYNDRGLTSLLSSSGLTTVTRGQTVGYSAAGVTWAIYVTPSAPGQVQQGPFYFEANLGTVSADVSVFNTRLTSVESSVDQYAGAATGVAATDEANIKAAIDRIAVGSRGTVHLEPGGAYVIHDVYRERDYITIDGHGATLTTNRNASSVLNDNVNVIWLIGNGCTVRRLRTVEGNPVTVDLKPTSGNFDHIRIGRVDNGFKDKATVEDVECVNSPGCGIQVNFADRTTIRNCDVTGAWGNGIGISGCREKAIIDGCRVKNTGDDGIAIVALASGAGSVPGGTLRVTIVNNQVEQCDAKGIGTTGVDYCTIANNHVKNTWTFGIGGFEDSFFGLAASNRMVIEGNTIEDAGKCFGVGRLHASASSIPFGIHCSKVAQLSILGNLIVNSQDRGINVDNLAAITELKINDNTVVGADGVGIICGNTDGTVYTDFTGVEINDNIIRDVWGGIALGCATAFEITGNVIRSYKAGAAGSRRGILVGHCKAGQVHGNTIYNDDTGDETILLYNSCVAVRQFGNHESTPSDGDHGNVFTIGDRKIAFGSAAPTTGTWKQGDVVFDTGVGNANPQASGWQCRAGGTPGTWKQFGHFGLAPYSGSVTWDPPSIADGAVATTDVTVTGVASQDEAVASFSTSIPAGAFIVAHCRTGNTVTVTLFNKTGAPLDLASGTVRVIAWRHQ